MPSHVPMDPEDEKKVRDHLVVLMQSIDCKDLLNRMVQGKTVMRGQSVGVFDKNDRDYINSLDPNTRSSRNDAFFKLLFRRGPDAYECFLEALREDGKYSSLAQLLEAEGKALPPGLPDSVPSIQHGCMRDEDEKKINRHMVKIMKELDAEHLLNFLFQEKVISENDLEKIRSHNRNTRENRNETFFTILFGRGVVAYSGFLRALRTCGYEHLANIIEPPASENHVAGTPAVQPVTEASGTDKSEMAMLAERTKRVVTLQDFEKTPNAASSTSDAAHNYLISHSGTAASQAYGMPRSGGTFTHTGHVVKETQDKSDGSGFDEIDATNKLPSPDLLPGNKKPVQQDSCASCENDNQEFLNTRIRCMPCRHDVRICDDCKSKALAKESGTCVDKNCTQKLEKITDMETKETLWTPAKKSRDYKTF